MIITIIIIVIIYIYIYDVHINMYYCLKLNHFILFRNLLVCRNRHFSIYCDKRLKKKKKTIIEIKVICNENITIIIA